jgi:hypothetical protein
MIFLNQSSLRLKQDDSSHLTNEDVIQIAEVCCTDIVAYLCILLWPSLRFVRIVSQNLWNTYFPLGPQLDNAGRQV